MLHITYSFIKKNHILHTLDTRTKNVYTVLKWGGGWAPHNNYNVVVNCTHYILQIDKVA